MHLSCLGPNPVSWFTLRRRGKGGRWLLLAYPTPHSPISQLLCNHSRGWQHLDHRHWVPFWLLSFTSGGQKSLMAVTFLVYWYGRRYFHFTPVKFYWGKNEDYGLGDSTSESSEKLLQRGREEGKYICDFSEERIHKIKHSSSSSFFFLKVSASLEEQPSLWRILVLF